MQKRSDQRVPQVSGDATNEIEWTHTTTKRFFNRLKIVQDSNRCYRFPLDPEVKFMFENTKKNSSQLDEPAIVYPSHRCCPDNYEILLLIILSIE